MFLASKFKKKSLTDYFIQKNAKCSPLQLAFDRFDFLITFWGWSEGPKG